MKTGNVWILIADGARARIIRALEPDGQTGDQLDDLVLRSEHKPPREIMTDRPGRSFASQGARRSAMEYRSDPDREQEQKFAASIVDELMRRYAKGEFDRLAVVAGPHMLGTIRQSLPDSLRQTIVAEIAKDLTKLPVKRLHEAILGLGIEGQRVNP